MRLLAGMIMLILGSASRAQVYHYINYNIKDGLAGSIVYTMCQDKDGFMWFGTDNGLSRYDGTHFTNFTIKDGLPDNEVLKLCADSKGRVWIGTFSKEICYYYNGKIYTQNNSDLLKKISLDNNPESIFESASHLIIISSRFTVSIITTHDSILRYSARNINNEKNIGGITYPYNGRIRFRTDNNTIYDYIENGKFWVKRNKIFFPKSINDSTIVKVYNDTLEYKTKTINAPGQVFSMLIDSGKVKYINTSNGTWYLDQISLKLQTHFLKGFRISNSMIDKEKNIWFTSLGNGVFKLPSLNIKTIKLNSLDENNNEVYSLISFNKKIFAGSNHSLAFFIKDDLETQPVNFFSLLQSVNKFGGDNRLFSSVSISDSLAILGFDGCIGKMENEKKSFKYLGGPVKSVEKINDTAFIAGTAFFAFKIRVKDLKVIDTIWRERCTKVFFTNNKYYIGTLGGLYEIDHNKKETYLGDLHPVLKRRITDIKVDEKGILWIASSDKGIVGLKDRKIVKVFDDASGLSSNNCKTLFTSGAILWVGTNKGICKIKIDNLSNNYILKYSISDGLPSNNINALLVKDNIVWVGTPEGVTFFDEKSSTGQSICNIKLTGVIRNGIFLPPDSIYNLSYRDNNIRFEFSGISFRSGEEIIYYYKLSGIDADWKTTTENYLDYKTLPSGNYRLELYAVNKYGVKSSILNIPISISTPYWKTIWFYGLIGFAITGLIIYFFDRRSKIVQKRLEEINRLQKQFAEMEQQALQSQMNPHFIFNCLNSIQQYILTHETQKANKYLTDFAHLIRQTLNISSQKTISLTEECEYLQRYLNMEQMRFGNNFKFKIELVSINNSDRIQIPSLLIQPFVENSLRHGIRHLTDRQGIIEITFQIKDEFLICQVKDNGIGRNKAAVFKSNQHIEYQSKGMSLTSKRINLLNTFTEKKITLGIEDLMDNDNNPSGTLVQLNIPL